MLAPTHAMRKLNRADKKAPKIHHTSVISLVVLFVVTFFEKIMKNPDSRANVNNENGSID